MKKAAVSLFVILAAGAICLFFLCFFIGVKRLNTPAENPSGGYLLKACAEGVGIYRAGEETPFETVEIPLSLLPLYDQAELETGVYVPDEAALRRLLEDYSS